jgi:hypothetical protein
MLSWHFVDRATYDAADASVKTADKLYFISDTAEIYRGTKKFDAAVELYTTTKPTTPAVGRLYVESTTLEGNIWNGSAWVTVIQPVQSSLSTTDTTKPVSGKAVSDYVATVIGTSADIVKNLAYTKSTATLTATLGDDTTKDIQIENLGATLAYDKKTGALTLQDINGTTLGDAINLDLERFVSAATYDPDTNKITLSFNDNSDPLEIDVADLVDTYTVEDTTSIDLELDSSNKITAALKLSADSNNALTVKTDGLFLSLANYQALVTGATANDVATLNANGQVIDSGVTVGGATLATSVSDKTLATEAAVEAIRSALQTNIDGKIAKLEGATAGHIVSVSTDGTQVTDSGLSAGGAELAETTSDKTLATEKAVEAAITALKVGDKQDKDKDAVEGNLAKFDANGNSVDAGIVAGGATLAETTSDKTLATEKAVEAALTWQTTV